MKVWKFSSSFSTANDAFPTGACRLPVLSTRNSIRPAFSSRTARPMSMVTVPAFGVGIRPRGPRIRPSFPTSLIVSGVATTASKSSQPSWIFCTYSVPTKSAPACSASLAFSP